MGRPLRALKALATSFAPGYRRRVYETTDELDRLQTLLDASLAESGGHLRGIIRPGERTISAEQLVATLVGVQHLVVATTTADGRPRTSAVDGHFLHARWVFTTSWDAVKARHLARRPAISVTHLRGDSLGVFTHGTAERLLPEHDDFKGVDTHLTAHYGESPSEWGKDIAYFRVQPEWMVVYAFAPQEYGGVDG